MTTLRQAAQQALEALENGKRVRAGEGGTKYQPPLEDSAITALRAALAQQEAPKGGGNLPPPLQAEPVLVVEKEPDYMSRGHFYEGSKPFIDPTLVWKLPIGTKLYTTPPRREWQGLSEEELYCWTPEIHPVIRFIEGVLKEKNHD